MLQNDARRLDSVRRGLDAFNQKVAANQLSNSAAMRLGGICAAVKAGDFNGALAQVRIVHTTICYCFGRQNMGIL